MVTGARAVLTDDEALKMARETLAKMTLEEKCSLMGGCATMYLNSIPRVGIHREWAFNDSTHGMKPEHRRDWWGYVAGVDDRSTCLPCQSALAATWNIALSSKHGHVMGEQMRARGKDQMLGPGVNIVRTPLCGRNWEYISEDPYLNARMVVPLIRAAQSHGLATTVKHFCLNNQELNRFGVGAVVDDRTLNEIYLPAFRAAIQEAGSLAVMTSYNKVNGIFASENASLIKSILRDRWGFKGLIVTDWGGQHSCDFAVQNGCGIEMNCGREIKYLTDFYGTVSSNRLPLATAVREGRILEATIDEAVLHTLYVMAKTGFLKNTQGKGERLTAKHQQICREIGEEAIVLAKNTKKILPLQKNAIKKLVLVGTFANLELAHLGSSCECHPAYEITPYEGLCEFLGNKVEIVRFPLGAEAGDERPLEIDNLMLETVDPRGGDAFVVRAWEYEQIRGGKTIQKGFEKYPKGDWKYNCSEAGKGPVQEGDILKWTAQVKAPETGSYALIADQGQYSSARIELNGKMLFDWNAERTKADCAFEKGQIYTISMQLKVGPAENRCLFGWIPPSAQKVSPAEKRRICTEADAVIVFTGTSMGWGRAKETEGEDRPDLREPLGHDEEIAEILSWKLPRTIVVNRSGSAMEMPWEPNCETLVIHSYLGQEAGRPLARVLFGEVNPSGKLPVTWPRRLADTAPAMLDAYNPTNVVYKERFYVGYRWHDARKIPPMFSFGHGLSYTTFAYAPIIATNLTVSVDVSNVGSCAGKEVVQFYVSYPNAKVERCVKELKGFEKVELQPGETKTVEHTFEPRDLAYWDNFAHRFRVDAGDYEVHVGSSSADLRSKAILRITENATFED